MNLRDDITFLMWTLQPDSIGRAHQQALEGETRLREKARLRGNNTFRPTSRTLPHSGTSNHPINTRQIPLNTNQATNNRPGFPNTGNSTNSNRPTSVTCNFCKKPGHTENQCCQKEGNRIFNR